MDSSLAADTNLSSCVLTIRRVNLEGSISQKLLITVLNFSVTPSCITELASKLFLVADHFCNLFQFNISTTHKTIRLRSSLVIGLTSWQCDFRYYRFENEMAAFLNKLEDSFIGPGDDYDLEIELLTDSY